MSGRADIWFLPAFATPNRPTVADLAGGIKLEGVFTMTEPIPATPERVTWADVRGILPDQFRPISYPHPIPGGALVLYQAYSPRLKRHLYHLFAVRLPEQSFDLVQVNGKEPAIYVRNDSAREALANISAGLRRAAEQQREDDERDERDARRLEDGPGFREHTDMVQDRDL